jgi:primosomal protein N'
MPICEACGYVAPVQGHRCPAPQRRQTWDGRLKCPHCGTVSPPGVYHGVDACARAQHRQEVT